MDNFRNILVIDDDEAMCRSIKRNFIEAKINAEYYTNPIEALEKSQEREINLLIIDYMMPHMNGIQVTKEIKRRNPDTVVILITGYDDFDIAVSAINEGIVYKLMTKPFDIKELIKYTKEAYEKAMENKNYNKFKNWSFKALGVNKNDDVTLLLQKNAIDGLMLLMKAKDEELYEHSVRISETAVIFGRHIGFGEEKVKDLYEAALLHDIGKLAIKDNILDKEGRLDSYEFDKIKMHPIVGAELIKKLGLNNNVVKYVLQHHERVDGKGYPYGLLKNEIEISSKIITIADAHDALSSKRSYKKALKHNEVYIIMEEMSGKVFDENLLEKFFMMLESI